MKRMPALTHEFVEFLPDTLEDGKIYISIPYATVTHRCCCGCGNEVVTPLSPTDWRLIFDGQTISLEPSIGSWSFPCQSHYWIKKNKVKWDRQWSNAKVAAGRAHDKAAKQRLLQHQQTEAPTGRGTQLDIREADAAPGSLPQTKVEEVMITSSYSEIRMVETGRCTAECLLSMVAN